MFAAIVPIIVWGVKVPCLFNTVAPEALGSDHNPAEYAAAQLSWQQPAINPPTHFSTCHPVHSPCSAGRLFPAVTFHLYHEYHLTNLPRPISA